ncbi:MAG TPA: outer membrane beta-barrel protein [Candidatus Acidoferrales bacterium]|nr:outer membrane beta-barrel protein [Candidatus Acidoferrales bacterium]
MKKIMWAATTMLLMTASSRAQDTPKADVAVGYANFLIAKGIPTDLSGVSGTVAVNANDWAGIAWDLGVYHGSPGGTGLTGVTYMVGPRFTLRTFERFTPYAQVLFGGARFSTGFNGVTNSSGGHFGLGLGIGTDIDVGKSGRFAVRPQIDYFGVRVNGSNVSNARLGIGLVYRFGKRKMVRE